MLVQCRHAKILTSRAVNIHAWSCPSSDCEGQSSVPECNPILHFQGQGAPGGVRGCLVGGEVAAATCFSQQEASRSNGLLGHDK